MVIWILRANFVVLCHQNVFFFPFSVSSSSELFEEKRRWFVEPVAGTRQADKWPQTGCGKDIWRAPGDRQPPQLRWVWGHEEKPCCHELSRLPVLSILRPAKDNGVCFQYRETTAKQNKKSLLFSCMTGKQNQAINLLKYSWFTVLC